MTGVRRDAALRVLAYHGIADHGSDPVLGSFSVPPDVFARQLDTLLRAGCHFIDGERFLRFLVGDCGLPRRPVLLTFDDCYRDLLEVALPLLEARDIPAVAFAVAGHVGGTNVWDRARGAPRQELLDAEGLRTLAARGVEIGAHGWSHRPLPEVPAGELAREVPEHWTRSRRSGSRARACSPTRTVRAIFRCSRQRSGPGCAPRFRFGPRPWIPRRATFSCRGS